MDCSLPGSSVHGILQARILEWVAKSAIYSNYFKIRNHLYTYTFFHGGRGNKFQSSLEHKDKLLHVSSKIRGSNLNIITNDELALKRIFWKLKATFIGHNNIYRFVSIVTDTVKGHSL